jgi:putative membrane protein
MNQQDCLQDFRGEIEKAITDVESVSSLEIVPVIVSESSDYQSVRISWSLGFSLIALLLFRFLKIENLGLELLGSVVFGLSVYGILSVEKFLSVLVPSETKLAEVQEHAAHIFLRKELFATQDRTGILILISVFEKMVWVLADRGITSVVGEAKFAELGTRLAADFDRKSPGVTFLDAIRTLGRDVASKFPPRADNPNELPDHVRID